MGSQSVVAISPLNELAARLRAAGDPLRLLILRLLARDAFGVLELCFLLDIKQPSLSHHLKVLGQAGLLTTRRERTTVFYRRHHQGAEIGSLTHRLFSEIDALALPADVAERLDALYQQRSEASQRFFAEHAHDFRQHQEQIAGFHEYGPLVAERLAKQPGHCLVEIGPGEGQLFPLVAQYFDQIIGIDSSPEMLEKARRVCQSHDLQHVSLHCPSEHRCADHSADAVVMNMVLHHVPNPTELMAEARRLLRPSGRLIITELCEHEQGWVREACGDAWLGFASDDLAQWAQQHNLVSVSADYLALRNGFRLQIHEFFQPPANASSGLH